MITIGRLTVIVVVSLFFASVCSAHEGENEVLLGLKQVVVAVSDLNPEIEKDGLKQFQLQADVESKLRATGIEVLSVEEGVKTEAPLFYAEVNIVKTTVPVPCKEAKDDIVVYSAMIMVQIKESVEVTRNSKSEGVATWSKHIVGATGNLSQVRSQLTYMMDEFIRAWLYSNHKTQ